MTPASYCSSITPKEHSILKTAFASLRIHKIYRKEKQDNGQGAVFDENAITVSGADQQPDEDHASLEIAPLAANQGHDFSTGGAERQDSQDESSLTSEQVEAMLFLQSMIDKTLASPACIRGAIEILCYKNEDYRSVVDLLNYGKRGD